MDYKEFYIKENIKMIANNPISREILEKHPEKVRKIEFPISRKLKKLLSVIILLILDTHCPDDVEYKRAKIVEKYLETGNTDFIDLMFKEKNPLETTMKIVSEEFNVTEYEILKSYGDWEIRDARNAISYLLRRLFNFTYAKIGEFLGNRTHATIVASERSGKNLYDTNKTYKIIINIIESKIAATNQ